MTKHTEVMKLALEALEAELDPSWNCNSYHPKIHTAMTALREALTSVPDWASEAIEQPAPVAKPRKQEPYGYVSTHTSGLMHFNKTFHGVYRDTATGIVAVYTSPPAQRKPLTDEQIDAEFDAFASKFDHESNEWLDMGVDAYFRAGFKAAHGIKEQT